jgi:uncharacterized membrane protein
MTLGVFVGYLCVLGARTWFDYRESRRLRTPPLDHGRRGLALVDLGVLIYFIHHIAKSIQLPEVIAGIARDLTHAIDAEVPAARSQCGKATGETVGRSVAELLQLIDERGAVVQSNASGYLQFVGYAQLVEIAVRARIR